MSYMDEARRLRPLIEKAVQSLDDADAVEAVTLYPHWASGASYTAGQRVQDKGILYTVLQDHVSQPGWEPSVAPSLFAKVLIPDDGTIPEWEQPESTNPYSRGDEVRHLGKIWISDLDNNVWEPGVYGWTEVEK